MKRLRLIIFGLLLLVLPGMPIALTQDTGVPLGEVVHFDADTFDPTTGAPAAADSTPSFNVYEEATDTAIVNGTSMTARSGHTGEYRGTFTASTGNGFELGKWYIVKSYATVGGLAGNTISMHFRVAAAENVAGTPPWATLLNTGTAQAGGALTITLASAASSSNSDYSRSGGVVAIVGGTGAGQSRRIISYVGSTRVATVDTTWVTNPNSTSIYIVFPGK